MHQLLVLSNRVSELERRMASMFRQGPVKEVNAAEGWVRLDMGEGDEGTLLSPKIPYAQVAGGLKIHTPPTEGQQMTWIAPNGDPTQAVALPMTWSDQNQSPSDKGDENVLTFGNVRAELRDGNLKLTIGGLTLDITASAATFSVGGVMQTISGSGVATTGGQVTHDGKNVGSTHKHKDVTPGPDKTGEPE